MSPTAIIPRSFLFTAEKSNPAINSSGSHIGFLSSASVYVIATENLHTLSLAKAVTDAAMYKERLYSLNLSTGAIVSVSPLFTTTSHVVGTSSTHPEYLLTLSNSNTTTPHRTPNLYKSNIFTGKSSCILQNDGHCTQYVAAHDFSACIVKRINPDNQAIEMLHVPLDMTDSDSGTPLPRRITKTTTIVTTSAHSPTQNKITTRQIITKQVVNGVPTVSEGNVWSQHESGSGGCCTQVHGFSKDLKSVYTSCFLDESSEYSSLVSVDLKTREKKVLARGKNADVVGCLVDPVTRFPWAHQTNKVKKSYGLVSNGADIGIVKDLAVLEYAFGFDGQWTVENMSQDGLIWVLRVKGRNCEPQKYYLYDRASFTPTLLFDSRPALDKYVFAVTKTVQVFTRGGLAMLAHLTIPKGLEAPDASSDYTSYPLPLVVLLQSDASRMDRDDFGFNPYAQFFANRGYAVISPQIRGMAGLGKTWRLQGSIKNHCNDIIDAVNWCIFKGIALQDKVAFYSKGIGQDELCRAIALKVLPVSHVLHHPILNVSYAQEYLDNVFGNSAQESSIKALVVKYLEGSRRDTAISL
ncbi:UNVERIFIED_CONTAM: hypothetical protein HDU68_001211 [Siphonaria sp. JEL0065]|nr:hypothetical protein HDU68_001211 [Siphonaria sp. JEL0065]